MKIFMSGERISITRLHYVMQWHKELGPILSASLNEYQLVEEQNMQIHSDTYYMPPTPRLQFVEDGVHYMNISDLSASISHDETKQAIIFHTQADLVDENQNNPALGRINCKIDYQIEDESIHITINGQQKMPERCR